jgi:integrase
MKKEANATFKQHGYEIHYGFRIRLKSTPAGKRYQVDLGRRSGKHVRKTCETKEEAIDWARKENIKIGNKGFAAANFSDQQQSDALEALDVLTPFGVNLRAAAKFYAKHHQQVDETNGFGALVEHYIQEKERNLASKDLRPRSLAEIKKWLKPCKEHFGHMAIDAIAAQDMDGLLDELGKKPTARNNIKRHLSGFFNWAITNDKTSANPVKRMRKIVVETHTPQIYTPKEVAGLFTKAEELHPELVPYLSLAFFAGVRPEEIIRLCWRDIDLSLGEIHIRAEQSKTRSARIVTIPENLKSWLLKYRQKDGAVFASSDSTLKRWRAEIHKEASIPSIQDGARHTFATFHLALEGVDETLHQLGHTDSKMLQRHYKGLAKNRKAQAEKFFQIVPDAETKIIQMKKAGAA